MTNKPRKRAPGGGRKPKGPISGNAGWLQARITADLHDRLKREAEQNGRSVSQEAQVRLKESFDLPAELQKAWGPPHIKALAQLVSRAVRSVETTAGADPFAEAGDLAWHRNSFTHAAVCAAVAAVLAHYKPARSMQTPPEVKKRAAMFGKEQAAAQCTPESVGLSCALGVIEQLKMQRPSLIQDATAHYAEGYYVFPHINDILGEIEK